MSRDCEKTGRDRFVPGMSTLCSLLVTACLCACVSTSSESSDDPNSDALKESMARYNLDMADKLLAQGKDDLAVRYLFRAIKAQPLFPEPRLRLIDLYLARNDMEAALVVFQNIPEELENNPQILERLVFILEEAGDREGALAVVERAVAAGAPPESFKKILAESSILASDFDRARDLLAQVCALDPEDAGSLEAYARLCRLTGRGKEECDAMMQLVALCPEDLEMPLRAARAFDREGMGGEALERFRVLSADCPPAQAMPFFRARAYLHYSKGDWARAVEMYLRIEECGGMPLERGERLNMAEAFLREGRCEESARLLRDLLEEEPQDAVVRAALAYAYWKSGSVARADEVVRSAPDPDAGNGILGAMKKRMGKGSVKR